MGIYCMYWWVGETSTCQIKRKVRFIFLLTMTLVRSFLTRLS